MNNDYLVTTRNGKGVYQHRLVWEAAHGPIPPGYHVHHKNENKRDNRLENLELVYGRSHHSRHSKELGATPEHKERGKRQMARIWSARPYVECDCQICGKKFTARGSNKGLPRTCSQTCKSKLYYRERGRERYFEQKGAVNG